MDGTLVRDGERYAVRFERHLRHPIDKVWRAISEPEELRQWFPDGGVEIDLTVGGKVKFAGQSYFKDDGSRTDGAGDGAQRLREQDEDGLDAELLFVPVFASRFLEKIPDRSIKAKAPDVIQPTGQWSPAAALDRLFRNYEGLAKFVESTANLREHVLESPPLKIVTNGAVDTADGYQWALTVAAHDERHVRQILEVKADPNYPAN